MKLMPFNMDSLQQSNWSDSHLKSCDQSDLEEYQVLWYRETSDEQRNPRDKAAVSATTTS
jgi:hypothetical protein